MMIGPTCVAYQLLAPQKIVTMKSHRMEERRFRKEGMLAHNLETKLKTLYCVLGPVCGQDNYLPSLHDWSQSLHPGTRSGF